MHVIKLQTHDHSNACRYRQSGQHARPAVSHTHPTQVRLLWTLWSCLLQGPSPRRSRRESFIIVCHLLYLFLREQLSQYTFVFASELFNRPKTIENNNTSLIPAVFSSQISSHSDSLEDVLLFPVNITTPYTSLHWNFMKLKLRTFCFCSTTLLFLGGQNSLDKFSSPIRCKTYLLWVARTTFPCFKSVKCICFELLNEKYLFVSLIESPCSTSQFSKLLRSFSLN